MTTRLRTGMSGAAALILLAAAGGGRAGETTPPTCALLADRALDLRRSPVVSLLEVKLTRHRGLRILERIDLEKVLQEQKLQLAFGPEGGAERVAIGRLLKADVLVLLRAGKEKAKYIDVVVCETKGGLRLLVRKAAWSDKPAEDAAGLEALTVQALGKYREDVTEICAVPPFVSRDLTHDYDHLQAAYARLIEQALLSRRGMLVVELAEARAVARELELAAETLVVRRKLPLYVMGEYRNDGLKDERRVSIALKLRRGKKELAGVKEPRRPPNEAASFLLRATGGLLAGVAGQGSLPDPETEAKQLAERARKFQRLGFWKEALDLIEASLLLRRDQPELHRAALDVTGMLAWAQYDSDPKNFSGKAVVGLRYYSLGLHHLDLLLRPMKPGSEGLLKELDRFILCSRGIRSRWKDLAEIAARARGFGQPRRESYLHSRSLAGIDLKEYSARLAEIGDTVGELERRKRESLLRFMEAKARAGELTDGVVDDIKFYAFPHPYIYTRWELRDPPETLGERLRARLRAIRAVKDLPSARRWTRFFASPGLPPFTEGRPPPKLLPAHREFISQITATDSAAVRGAGEELSRRFSDGVLPRRPPGRRPPELPTAPEETALKVGFKEVRLTWEEAPERSSKRSLHYYERVSSWLPCGKGIDVVKTWQEIWVMRERGRLRRIFKVEDRRFRFRRGARGACFDGRYVWMPTVGREGPLILVVDPESERVFEVTADDGLPPTGADAVIAPLAPGKACVAGSLRGSGGKGALRSWCAIVELARDGTKSVDVFHEARVQTAGQSEVDYESARLAFRPVFMVTLADENDGTRKRVLLIRSTPPKSITRRPFQRDPARHHPLLIDPRTRSVTVVQERIDVVGPNPETCHSGAMYWVFRHVLPDFTGGRPSGGTREYSLWRFGFPDFRKTAVARGLPDPGRAIFHDDRIHVIGHRYWRTAKSFESGFKALQVEMPDRQGHFHIFRSHHYGLLFVVWNPYQVFKAEFTEVPGGGHD